MLGETYVVGYCFGPHFGYVFVPECSGVFVGIDRFVRSPAFASKVFEDLYDIVRVRIETLARASEEIIR